MLKKQLVHSIEALLVNTSEPERIKRLIKTIKSKNSIKDTPDDYFKALVLIFIMYLRWPEIRTNPNNTELITLGNICLKQAMPILSGMKNIASRNIK